VFFNSHSTEIPKDIQVLAPENHGLMAPTYSSKKNQNVLKKSLKWAEGILNFYLFKIYTPLPSKNNFRQLPESKGWMPKRISCSFCLS
jgi:hypothetical protein